MVPKCNARLCYMYKSKSQIKREYKFHFEGTAANDRREVGVAWSHSHSYFLPSHPPSTLPGQEADSGFRNSRWRPERAAPPAVRDVPRRQHGSGGGSGTVPAVLSCSSDSTQSEITR